MFMFRFFPIILILQAFCLYHAFKNNTQQKWYWIIIFFPFFGSIFYLYENFYSRKNLQNIKEGVKSTIVSNYTLDKLEKQVKISNSVANRKALADEHIRVGNYDQALELYLSCNEGIFKDNPDILLKIIRAAFLKEDFEKVITYGSILGEHESFKHSKERIAFAWAHHHTYKNETAEKHFKAMDLSFSNHEARFEYAKFLHTVERKEECKAKLMHLIEEINSMEPMEKRSKRGLSQEMNSYLKKL